MHCTLASILASILIIITPENQIPDDLHVRLKKSLLTVKTSDSPKNFVFAMLEEIEQIKANHWKPFSFVICTLQKQACTRHLLKPGTSWTWYIYFTYTAIYFEKVSSVFFMRTKWVINVCCNSFFYFLTGFFQPFLTTWPHCIKEFLNFYF